MTLRPSFGQVVSTFNCNSTGKPFLDCAGPGNRMSRNTKQCISGKRKLSRFLVVVVCVCGLYIWINSRYRTTNKSRDSSEQMKTANILAAGIID